MTSLTKAAQFAVHQSTLLFQCDEALTALDQLLTKAVAITKSRVSKKGDIDRNLMEEHQHSTHGLAWLATYIEALRQTLTWAKALQSASALSSTELYILKIGFGEYLAQIIGGIPMNQGEMIRLGDLGIDPEDIRKFCDDNAVAPLIHNAHETDIKRNLAEQISARNFGNAGLDDTMSMIQDQFRRFTKDKVIPNAQDWHHNDDLIPYDVISEMGNLGVFGLTIPEEYGGSGLGKLAMCVVSEELSRGYIGVGSLGTRSEIAAELILSSGTDEQKSSWLPKIASADILPTAVFTEPNTGSDLGALRTKAVRKDDYYTVCGNKTWITHAARADVMTLLARTDPNSSDYRGLSMFLAEKPRGTVDKPFPVQGLKGSEIEVLGYRGMKEYELSFDDFHISADQLLGGVEGQGFKQLMKTFESARIQTAARAIGVGQSALESGLDYALERQQFGKAIFEFPRVQNKLISSAVELMVVRQLTYFAARQKDTEKRCDLEAGMAKLLAARVAWTAADNALQIHGGNGYALEYPISRILCDARILNIFEGAAEIQADVIARRLLTA